MKVVLIAEMLIVLVEPKKMMVREWYLVVFVKIGSIYSRCVRIQNNQEMPPLFQFSAVAVRMKS
jgi:hypothetical protein